MRQCYRLYQHKSYNRGENRSDRPLELSLPPQACPVRQLVAIQELQRPQFPLSANSDSTKYQHRNRVSKHCDSRYSQFSVQQKCQPVSLMQEIKLLNNRQDACSTKTELCC